MRELDWELLIPTSNKPFLEQNNETDGCIIRSNKKKMDAQENWAIPLLPYVGHSLLPRHSS